MNQYGKYAFLAAALVWPAIGGPGSLAAETAADDTTSAEWPQWGGTAARNNTPNATNLPVKWEVGRFDIGTNQWLGEGNENIAWVAKLGSESYGSPVIAGGKIFLATNNAAGYLQRYPATVDLGCLLAFGLADGGFLWQHSVEKLAAGDDVDYRKQGICCSPLVEEDRLWIVTNRAEVVCLDTRGFADGENDGPFVSETSTEAGESDVIWSFDMMRTLGSIQHQVACCSVVAAGDLLFVSTSNGVDGSDVNIPAPDAPSFIALEKHTGKLVWADASPGENILDGQWASPALATLGGVPQVIFPAGDGWLYSFRAERTASAELLWKFDCNPKQTVWKSGGRGDRNTLIATPVIHDGLVYIATGKDPEEAGEDQGDLWCIDPTGRGDTSAELVVDSAGKPAPRRRFQAVDAGEKVIPNPNSAAVWHYRGEHADGDGEHEFKETMHQAIGMAAVKDGLLVIGDFAGLVHCLDAKTGKVHWTHDMMSTIWGSPLMADGKIYLSDGDGDLAVFELSSKRNLLAENNMGNSVYSTPTAIGQTLYISTRSHIFAIRRAGCADRKKLTVTDFGDRFRPHRARPGGTKVW